MADREKGPGFVLMVKRWLKIRVCVVGVRNKLNSVMRNPVRQWALGLNGLPALGLAVRA